jgi:hypothetical protein
MGRGRPRKWCARSRCANRPGPVVLPPGSRFERWTVVEFVRRSVVVVRCDCGTERVLAACELESGRSKSCGCRRSEVSKATLASMAQSPGFKHGLSGTPEYAAWANIKRRIFNPACPAYPNYGGRGLTMEPDWVGSFGAFLAHVGSRPAPHLSIDRINNDLGYVKGNLRWATPAEQTANRRAA